MRLLAFGASLCCSALTLFAATAQEHLRQATEVFQEIMATPDKSIPQDLLDKAHCVVIAPGVKKGAFIVGGEFGKGIVTCRNNGGTGWGAPAAIRIEGGSFGAQIGGQSADIVMLVMNRRGMDKLMSDKFTLGADASVAAGPVGRTAAAMTDAQMTAEILSWSRTKGLFAGIALKGATLRPDKEDNRELYRKTLTTRDILMSNMALPPAARPLAAELAKHSPAEKPSPASAEREETGTRRRK
jgi:lipid-binding SYLF domain-containing protein